VQRDGGPQKRPDPFATDSKIQEIRRNKRTVSQHCRNRRASPSRSARLCKVAASSKRGLLTRGPSNWSNGQEQVLSQAVSPSLLQYRLPRSLRRKSPFHTQLAVCRSSVSRVSFHLISDRQYVLSAGVLVGASGRLFVACVRLLPPDWRFSSADETAPPKRNKARVARLSLRCFRSVHVQNRLGRAWN